MGAAAEHGILDALSHAQVHVLADNGYQGARPMVQVPQRRRRLDPETGRYRRLSQVSGILSPQSVATRCCAGSLRASAIAAGSLAHLTSRSAVGTPVNPWRPRARRSAVPARTACRGTGIPTVGDSKTHGFPPTTTPTSARSPGPSATFPRVR